MREMRYLWREPIRMDNSRLIAVLGKEPHTPLDDGVEATLIGLGSLAPTNIHRGATPHTAKRVPNHSLEPHGPAEVAEISREEPARILDLDSVQANLEFQAIVTLPNVPPRLLQVLGGLSLLGIFRRVVRHG